MSSFHEVPAAQLATFISELRWRDPTHTHTKLVSIHDVGPFEEENQTAQSSQSGPVWPSHTLPVKQISPRRKRDSSRRAQAE